ncbi:hypothetical protein Taro_020610, partial [Colocasia esculenta]|nr:hypothetical protein [Colocasia esculenta]
MEVLRPVSKQLLGILLTKGTVPLKDNTTPSTPAGLLLFPGQEGSPLLLQVKKPTSWYKPQCSSARHKLLAGFYTIVSHLVVYETSSKSSDSESVSELKDELECTSSSPTIRARLTCSFSDSELDDSELSASSFSQIVSHLVVYEVCKYRRKCL